MKPHNTLIAETLQRIRYHLQAIGTVAAHPHCRADYQQATRLLEEALALLNAPAEHVLPGSLTPREKQILQLLQHGHSNSKIATMLGVTPGTVKTYLKSIYTKLGVQNRTQAAMLMHQGPRPLA